ncbi:YqiA/YcfP family alpha/beta fold hydrolase [Azospira restricta]|uniref:Esterase n=1 Tax=Azospira restricta TaxID=404405 RepID=A0A974Y432_9RHOO|nr:YqiA/YcfP family alpha/beta fold hydrolase [Azospira restricta]QRJ64250.1 esterase [Azospira restricta]
MSLAAGSPSLLYLHGFRSSPQSWKARLLGAALAERGLADRFHCPALSHDPAVAIAQAEAILAEHPACTLLGSSLGGYYATWLAEKYGLPAVLINPAVVAPLSLEAYVGPQTNLYSGEVFEFTAAHIATLRALEVPRITPERYWLLVEEGDELLDYRAAVSRYAGCRQTVLPGGDHSFTRFPDFVPQIIEFCGL